LKRLGEESPERLLLREEKKTTQKLSHAPQLEKIKGFTDEEKHFISKEFGSPWKEVSLTRQNYKHLIVARGCNDICNRLAELANIQWQYSERLIAIGKKRLRLLFQKREYNLQRVRYNESLKGYINEKKIGDPKDLPEILQPRAIILVASKVIIFSLPKNEKGSWDIEKNKEAIQKVEDSWTTFVKSLIEFPLLGNQ